MPELMRAPDFLRLEPTFCRAGKAPISPLSAISINWKGSVSRQHPCISHPVLQLVAFVGVPSEATLDIAQSRTRSMSMANGVNTLTLLPATSFQRTGTDAMIHPWDCASAITRKRGGRVTAARRVSSLKPHCVSGTPVTTCRARAANTAPIRRRPRGRVRKASTRQPTAISHLGRRSLRSSAGNSRRSVAPSASRNKMRRPRAFAAPAASAAPFPRLLPYPDVRRRSRGERPLPRTSEHVESLEPSSTTMISQADDRVARKYRSVVSSVASRRDSSLRAGMTMDMVDVPRNGRRGTLDGLMERERWASAGACCCAVGASLHAK
eukprot:scaffold270440_cov35-Tisochrysis_lutea.AAC.2